MRVPFLGVIVLCATAFVHAAAAAPADTFAVRWEPDQPAVLNAPNADPLAAGDSLPTPPSYTENHGRWLSDGTSDATGCGNQDCVSCLLCPRGYAYAESLFMTRTNGNATQPILFDVAGGTLLATNDLNFNWSPGLRAGAGVRLCDSLYLDLGYLGLYDSHASATFNQGNSGIWAILPNPIGPVPDLFTIPKQVRVDYWSQLNSFELNLLCCDCCCSTDPCDGITCGRSLEWFGGFRYISLTERLLISGDVGRKLPDGRDCLGEYDLSTNNNLYGAQLGARTRYCCGRFGYEATGKAGIYGNDANEKQTWIDWPRDFPLRPTVTGRGAQVAFVGEINLSAIYQLTKTWNVRAGYNLLWINGVALAPNQLDFTNDNYNPPISGSQLNTDGGVFYHGASIGLEARW
ncbi:MAG: BBP7 family outer membrane beta-barrel protein [Planctomycetota bacterium]|nr:BBP7 family outer membrane beta-barrel protein [Planctomycetota bacterium]